MRFGGIVKKTVLILLMLISFTGILLATGHVWQSLKIDGLHDPDSPAIGVLQEPGEALSQLPPDTIGNQVSWVKALRENDIEPLSSLLPGKPLEVLEMEIILENTGEMPLVMFPHRPHTEWLACHNCHDSIFKEKVGANPINMLAILSGEYCGRCHGAVAFPLTECNRCHSVPRNTFKGQPGVQPDKSMNNNKGNNAAVTGNISK